MNPDVVEAANLAFDLALDCRLPSTLNESALSS